MRPAVVNDVDQLDRLPDVMRLLGSLALKLDRSPKRTGHDRHVQPPGPRGPDSDEEDRSSQGTGPESSRDRPRSLRGPSSRLSERLIHPVQQGQPWSTSPYSRARSAGERPTPVGR